MAGRRITKKVMFVLSMTSKPTTVVRIDDDEPFEGSIFVSQGRRIYSIESKVRSALRLSRVMVSRPVVLVDCCDKGRQ